MTLTRTLAVAARWWPAPVAAIAFASIVLSHVDVVAAALAACGALAVARRWPIPALAAALASAPLAILTLDPSRGGHVGPMLVAALACMLAIFDIEPMVRRLYAGGAVVVTSAMAGATRATLEASAYGYETTSVIASTAIGYLVLGVLVWAIPFSIRAFQAALRAEREKTTVEARTVVVESELRDERLRADLTHDFHDVMAHSLAVLAAQAEGLRLTHEQHPERIAPVLTTISDTARLALVEVRQLLERVDDDARRPQPSIEDVPALVDQTRSTGMQVAFHDAGRRGSLPRIGGIAAYRIVQEALTNALRHGGGDADVVVTLSWTGPGLSLAISSPIRDRAALGPIGRGIAGMHERARQAGGWADVDADGDRFVVTAYLPYEPEAAGSTILREDQLPTVPVHVVQGAAPGARPDHDAAARPTTAAAPSTLPTPAASWDEANAREVRLGEHAGPAIGSDGTAPHGGCA